MKRPSARKAKRKSENESVAEDDMNSVRRRKNAETALMSGEGATEEKAASDVGNGGGETLDDIFGKLKASKAKAQDIKDGEEEGDRGSKRTKGDKGSRALKANESLAAMQSEDWRDDGLGGVFNKDGWTGRRNKEGMRIFKTHLLMRQNEVFTKGGGKCPFDCNCCFI